MKLSIETTKADAICATLIAVVAGLLLLVGGCTAAAPQDGGNHHFLDLEQLTNGAAQAYTPTNGSYQGNLRFRMPLLEYETAP